MYILLLPERADESKNHMLLHQPDLPVQLLVCVLSVVRQEIVATVGVCFPQSLLTLGIAGLIAQGSAALISFVGVATIAMLSRGARH